MKPIIPEAPPTTTPIARLPDSFSEYRPHERWLVRGLLAVGVVMIVAGLWQTIGRDAVSSTRRLPIFRNVAPLPDAGAMPSHPNTNEGSSHTASSSLTGLPSTSRSFGERRSPDVADGAVVNAAARPGERPVVEQAAPVVKGLGDKQPMPNDAIPPAKPAANEAIAIPAELLQAAQWVNLGWQDFDYPVKWFAAETSKPRMLYNGHRNRLLNAIAHPRPSELSLAQLRKDYATACEQFDDDPRLDYAFGLALWHHGERSEALDIFQTAARLEQTPFLPAALAVGWSRLLLGDEKRGLDQLSHVAKLLRASSGPYPTQTQKEQAAQCLGRAFGFLNGPGRTSELAEAAELTARNVRERLHADLRLVFEEGFDQVGQRESDLLQFASLPENALATEHRQQSEELQTRIDALRDEMQQTRQELARDHLSHLSNVTGFLSDALNARAESSTLQPLIQQIRDSITHLAQPQPHVVVRLPSGELVAADSGTSPTNGSRTTGSAASRSNGQGSRTSQSERTNTGRRQQLHLMPETPVEQAARMAKLEQARRELKQIQEELTALRGRHQELLDQRRRAEAAKVAETKETRKLQADRVREQRDLEQRLRELNTALRQTQGLRNSLDTIAAYVPWTIEVEGEALRLALTKKREQ